MRENEIGVVICNYNKKDYVLKCIESLQKQTYKDMDIYVVDNASIDGSADAVSDAYGDLVHLVRNSQNLGGSGGFNSGLREAMKWGYKYFVLLDNDVVLDENCIGTLYRDMESHTDVGIMGCKILMMDKPDTIQEFAPIVNYETMTFELRHGGEKDGIELPDIQDCDYVPACALIVRREVIADIGLMPEGNFIYYDDIEWGVRCNCAGYRVVANSKANAWHKGGNAINPTTFGNYYLARNKVKFFTVHMQTKKIQREISKEEIEKRADLIMRDIFEGIYSCSYSGNIALAKTRMDGFIDALEQKEGKAQGFEIRERENTKNGVEKLMDETSATDVVLYANGNEEAVRRIILTLRKYANKSEKVIGIEVVDSKLCGNEIAGIKIVPQISKQSDALEMYVCKHIYKLDIDCFDRVWVDGWTNVIANEKDYQHQQAYRDAYSVFKLCFEDRLINLIEKNVLGDSECVRQK